MAGLPTIASSGCADRLFALADENRLRIVTVLRRGPMNVSQIAKATDSDVATVSHHLQILKDGGIVESNKLGRFVIYRLHPDVRTERNSLDFGCCKFRMPA